MNSENLIAVEVTDLYNDDLMSIEVIESLIKDYEKLKKSINDRSATLAFDLKIDALTEARNEIVSKIQSSRLIDSFRRFERS